MAGSLCKAVIIFAIPALLAVTPVFGHARSGDLEAAPWKHIANAGEEPPLGMEYDESFWDMTPERMNELPKLAEEGNAPAAAVLGDYFREEREDANQAARWFRMAVRSGDVDSAFALGELYFPVGGSLGREDFAYKPDAVLGYVWYAIALSGLVAVEENGGKARRERERVQELVDGLRTLLLPSERARAAAILSEWPEAFPPETPLEPMPTMRKDAARDRGDADSPPDADAVVEIVRQWVTVKNTAGATVLLNAPPEFAPVLASAFEKMRTLAEAGDEEAEYMVAWCRLYGLGTKADEAAAMPFFMAKAEAGDAEAMFLVSALLAEQGDRERAYDFAVRAAEKGHGGAMMLLSQFLRDQDQRGEAALWMEKAAETGERLAVEEMISIAESSRNMEKIVFWLTVNMLRAPEPAVAYRCRMLIAYVGSGEDEEVLQQAMGAGERWHNEHPSIERR